MTSTMQAMTKEENSKSLKEISSALTSSIGIIVPPPEIKAIIDKTSKFVAKNGMAFEEKIRNNESSNPKFNFLNVHDPYYAYYRNNLALISKGLGLSDQIPTIQPETEKEIDTVKIDDKSNYHKFTSVQAQKYKPTKGEALLRSVSKFIDTSNVGIPEQFPSHYEFICQPPNMSIGDIEIIRMTAQFVAKGGQAFLNSLMEREKRNYFFDFLKPQHACFNFFNAMIDQYSKIITPSINKLKELDESSYDLTKLIKRVKDRYYYAKISTDNANKEAEELEKERVAFAQIDWNDFVIVEQINFKEDDKLTLPEPVTLEALGDRILHQQRLLEEKAEADAKEAEDAISAESAVKEEDKPLIVVKDYDPKKTKRPLVSSLNTSNLGSVDDSLTKTGVQMMISPITGELIPSDSLAEHMKVSLLDPRWKEEKKRLLAEKEKQNQVFVTGDTVSSYLKDLAQHRSDIFGDNTAETQIGRKMNKEISAPPTKSTQSTDSGPTMKNNTIPAQAPPVKPFHSKQTTQAQQNGPKISLSNKNLHQHLPPTQTFPEQSRPQNLPPIPPLNNGEPMPPPNMPMFMPPVPPHGMPLHMGMPPSLPVHPPPMPMGGHNMLQPLPNIPPQSHNNMPPPINTGHQAPPPNMHMPPQNNNMPPIIHQNQTAPHMNKPVGGSHIFSEINLHVQITFPPDLSQKYKWNFSNQVITFHVDLSWPVSKLKSMITDASGMPASKQKIATFQGAFLKDSNSLGYYHLMENSMLYLSIKERGGR